MKSLHAALLALAIAAPAPLALAQQATPQTVTLEQAIDIARAQGIVEFLKIERDDGKWEMEGCDATAHELEVDIHAQSADLLKIKRDRTPDTECLRLVPQSL